MKSKHVLELFRLDGKVAIVTGSARGLGQAIAQGLAEAGADIALVDVLPLEESVKKIKELGSDSHHCRSFSSGFHRDHYVDHGERIG